MCLIIFRIVCNTGWPKSLCAADDYNTYVRCTETFWSPCTKYEFIVRKHV